MTEGQVNFPELFGVYRDASLSERVTHLEFNASRKVYFILLLPMGQ